MKYKFNYYKDKSAALIFIINIWMIQSFVNDEREQCDNFSGYLILYPIKFSCNFATSNFGIVYEHLHKIVTTLR